MAALQALREIGEVICQGCINRQKRLVQLLCKKPDGALCRKARERLERMQAKVK